MSQNNNFTIKQHYISKLYYKHFSVIDQQSDVAFTWQFDTNSMCYKPNYAVSVSNICHKDNLYEIRDKEGDFVSRNTIENIFGRIESETNIVIEGIINKSKNEKCLNCSTVLSEEEKNQLILFITSLQFRDPNTINSGIRILQSQKSDIDVRDARNFTLLNLIPTGIGTEWDKNTIIRKASEKYSGMGFQIGYSMKDDIITSDRPVIEWLSYEHDSINKLYAVAFPLTSKLILYMYPKEKFPSYELNCFFRLSEAQIKDSWQNVAAFAKRFIYSKNQLTEEQIELVKDVRRIVCKG